MKEKNMREQIIQSLQEGAKLRLQLVEMCVGQIARAAAAVVTCFQHGGKVLLFGNGGSAADAQHVAAEFVGHFQQDRGPFPAIALTTDTSILTAIGNDYGFKQIFARQIGALGQSGDVAVAISTSGCSANVLIGVEASRQLGMITIGLTGGNGGKLAEVVDIPLVVPSANTAHIQECHITIGHLFCEIVETILVAGKRITSKDRLPKARDKIVDWDELLALREQWRVEGKTIVWTNGCFDLLHLGHVHSLRVAKSLGDILVVGVNSDNSVRQLKGIGRPFIPVSDRVKIVAALSFVDYVIIFNELTPEKVLTQLKPNVHCKGADYKGPEGKSIPEKRIVQSYGGRVEFIPLLPGRSTSALIRQIIDNEQEKKQHGK